jgi:hypothetical protein
MLFLKTNSADPISFFNEDPGEILEGEIFSSADEAKDYERTHASIGYPFLLEMNVATNELKKMIDDLNNTEIAAHVEKINGKEVELDESAKLHYRNGK